MSVAPERVSQMRKRKSIPFYIVCFCLALIAGSSLFALLWQPGFEQGIITIKIMDSIVAFHLWRFFASVLLLLIFIYFFVKTYRYPKKEKPAFVTALSAGLIFILLLDHITYGWTSYPSLAPLGIRQLTLEKYNLVRSVIKSIIVIAIAFLLFRWYKPANNSAHN